MACRLERVRKADLPKCWVDWNERPFAVSARGSESGRHSAKQLEESLKGFWTVRPGKAM